MKTLIGFTWRVVVVAVASIVVVGALTPLISGLLPADPSAKPESVPSLPTVLASFLLITGVLAYPVSVSRLRGLPLVGVMFLALVSVNMYLNLIEGAIFLPLQREMLLQAAVTGTVQALAISLLLVIVFGKLPRSADDAAIPRAARLSGWAWARKFSLAGVGYLILYFTAGLLIYPYIRPFYESMELNMDPLLFIPYQLVRGAVLAGVAVPLIRSMAVGRRKVLIASALLYPILGGIAPLIMPNSFMPDWVRYYHMIEVGWSNFVFGLLVAWLFSAGVRQPDETQAIETNAVPAENANVSGMVMKQA